jgi:hypothetical protein
MVEAFRVTPGDTFRLEAVGTRRNGLAAPLSGIDWAVELFDPRGALVQSLTVVDVDLALGHRRIIALPAETATWPLGELRGYIRQSDEPAEVATSPSFVVEVGRF